MDANAGDLQSLVGSALFSELADRSTQGIGIADLDGNIRYMNSALKRMLLVDDDVDLNTLTTSRLYSEEDMREKLPRIRKTISKGETWRGRIRLRDLEGSLIETEQNTFIFQVGNEKLWANIITDISHLKEVEDKLTRERDQMNSFMDALGDWVWEMNTDGIHTYSNNAVEKILGYSKDEIIGTDAIVLWPERFRTKEQMERHFRSLKSGEGWSNFQATFRHKDGSSRYLLSSAIPLLDEDGKLKGYRGIDRDITDRVRQDKELRESKERMQSILENAVEVIFSLDLEGRIAFISPSVKDVTGYDPEQIVGEQYRDFLHPDDIGSTLIPLRKIANGDEKVQTFEFRFKHRMGKWVWVRGNISPITSASGEIVSMVGVGQDVTERRDNENRIIQYNDLLKLINKILRHDLTNNLFMIRTSMEHYRMVEDEKWLESADRKIEMSFDLIDQMRDLESIVSSGGPLRIVDIREALERIRTGYDITINIDCDCRIMADDAFYSVIENLIRNAVLHGKTQRMDFICEEKDEGSVVLSAKDFGKGISDDVKEKVFRETFSHGKTGGTGLGLYIVKKTIERYGGNVTVSDNPEGGTIFRMELQKAAR